MNKLLIPLATLLLGCCPALAQSPAPSPAASASPALPGPTDGNFSRVSTVDAVHTRRLEREAAASADNIGVKDNFGAQLWLVQGRQFFQNWQKPGTPSIDPVQLAIRGETLYTALIFYGATHGTGGLINVSYDITVTRPDGTIYDRRDAAVGMQALAPPDDRQLILGRDSLGITISPTDPAGIYTVRVDVHDNMSRVTLPLKQTFVVQ